MSHLEQKTVLEPAFLCLKGLFSCFLVVTEGIVTASFKGVDITVIISTFHELVVNIHGLLVVPIVESAVSDPKVSLGVVAMRTKTLRAKFVLFLIAF